VIKHVLGCCSALGADAEKIPGKVGALTNVLIGRSINVVFTVVLSTAADGFESGETRSRGSVRVNVENVATLDILKKSHRGVASIVLHHFGVRLACSHVVGWVLEDAALAVRAL